MRSDARRATGAAASAPLHLVGNVNLDIVMGPVEPWPKPGSERIVARQEARAGGAAGVTALALSALGARYRLHARVGDDALGALLRGALGSAGKELEVAHASTAVSLGVTHPDGERTFLTHLGHLALFDVEAVAAELERSPPALVLICGYFLLPALRFGAGRELMRRCRAAGHRLAFDGGWPSEGFTTAVREELDGLLPWVDLALPNEVEALGWTGAERLEAAAGALARHGATVVVKRGRGGASWWEAGGLHHRKAPPVAAADTAGAGDCFNAALLAALLRGATLPVAVAAAVRYASAVVARDPRSYRPPPTSGREPAA